MVLVLLLAAIGIQPSQPVKAGIIIAGELTHERVVTPGETVEGVIVIRNPGNTPEEVKVFQTDYLFTCDGQSYYQNPGDVVRSNATWIEFSPKRFSLPVGDEFIIHYTIRIPQVDTLKGTYWSMIMVEPIPQSSPERALSEDTIGLTTVLRYGIQIVSHIGQTGSRDLKFLDTRLLNIQGDRILQVDLENTGERWLKPLVWVDLYDMTGNHIGKYEGDQLRTYPGTSIRQKIALSSIQPGKYKALIIADCGEEDLFGIHYTLTINE
jgi:hypothetical protein